MTTTTTTIPATPAATPTARSATARVWITAAALAVGLGLAGCGDAGGAVVPADPADGVDAARAEPEGCDPSAACSEAPEAQVTAIGQHLDLANASGDWLSGAPDGDKVAVVVFFEVWCPHCKSEMPRLVDVDGLDGVQVVGLTKLTRGATEDQVRAFVEEHGIGYAVGVDTRDLSQAFGVRGVPSAVVVRDGTVVWQGHPMQLTTEQLRGWL